MSLLTPLQKSCLTVNYQLSTVNCQLSTIQLFLLSLDLLVVDIVIVGHQLVDGALRCQFDDTVGHGIDKLMVVRGEEDITLELDEVVVEGLDRLEV